MSGSINQQQRLSPNRTSEFNTDILHDTNYENQHSEDVGLNNQSSTIPPTGSSRTSTSPSNDRKYQQRSFDQQYRQTDSTSHTQHHNTHRQPSLLLFGFPCHSFPPMTPLKSANDLESWKLSASNYFDINNVHVLVEKPITESFKRAKAMNQMAGFLNDDMLLHLFEQRCRQLTAIMTESLKVLSGIGDIRKSFTVKYSGSQYREQNQIVEPYYNPYLLWSHVNSSSSDTSFISWNNLYRQLTTLKYKEGESPSVMFGKLESIRSKINECKAISFPAPGNKLPDELYSLTALESLPDTDSYQQMKNLILHTTDSKDVLNKLKDALQLKYEESINEKGIRKQQRDDKDNKARVIKQETKDDKQSSGQRFDKKGKKGNKKKVYKSGHQVTESEVDDDDESIHLINNARSFKELDTPEQARAFTPSTENEFSCVLDSAASRHIFCTTSLIHNQTRLPTPIKMQSASGHTILITHEGSVLLSNRVQLNNVAVAKGATCNLISATQLVRSGFRIVLDNTDAQITYRKSGKPLPIKFKFDDKKLEYSYDIQSKHVDRLKNKNSDKPGIEMINYKPKIPRKSENKPATDARKELEKQRNERKTRGQTAKAKPQSRSPSTTAKASRVQDKSDSDQDSEVEAYTENLYRITEMNNQQQLAILSTVPEPLFIQDVTDKYVRENSLPANVITVRQVNATEPLQPVSATLTTKQLIHCRMGHQSHYKTDCTCRTCIQSKSRKERVGMKSYSSATKPYQSLHSDIIGPVSSMTYNGQSVRQPSFGGSLYILHVMDEFSHYTWSFPIKHKGEATQQFINLLQQFANSNKRVEQIHTDGGTEFVNKAMKEYTSKIGIQHIVKPAYTPSMNGKIERQNGITTIITKALLIESKSPLILWAEAFQHATLLFNVTPLASLKNKTPHEVLLGTSPTTLTSKLKIWGSDAYYHNDTAGKFQSNWSPGIYIGYNTSNHTHRILTEQFKVLCTRNVKLVEGQFTNMIDLAKGEVFRGHQLHMTDELANYDVKINERSAEIVQHRTDNELHVQPIDSSIHELLPEIDQDDHLVSTPSTYSSDTDSHSELIDSDPIDTSSAIAYDEPSYDSDSERSVTSISDMPLFDSSNEAYVAQQNLTTDQQEEKYTATDSDTSLNDSSELSDTDSGALHDALEVPDVLIIDNNLPTSRYGRTIKPVEPYGGMIHNKNYYDPEDQRYIDKYIGTDHIGTQGRFRSLISITNNVYAINQPTDKSLVEPRNYKEAIQHVDADKWKLAMNTEIASLEQQQVWSLVKREDWMSVIPNQWVYTVKLDAFNIPIKHKARLVIRGDRQQLGVNYNETWAPVAKMKSVKILLSLAAEENLQLYQIDFKTAFLNAKLDDDVIFMKQPQGYIIKGTDNVELVCRLNKALYGLKQAPLLWNSTIHQFFTTELGYAQSRSDPCIYFKKVDQDQTIIFSLYVDDMLILVNKSVEHIWLSDKAKIIKQFEITDIGKCEWILNMFIQQQSNGTIKLSQRAYIERLLEVHSMENCNGSNNPAIKQDLVKMVIENTEEKLTTHQHTTYRALLGGLIYLANTTRMDISYVVGLLSRYVSSPTLYHLKAAKHVLRYLKQTIDYVMEFKPTHSKTSLLNVDIYVDASWNNDPHDCISTTGIIVKLQNNVINWLSKKQLTPALSSCEAEYMALSAACQEGIWLKQLLTEIYSSTKTINVNIKCDSQSAIALAFTDVFHARSKHIDLRYKFILDVIKRKEFNLEWIKTSDQLGDILTKVMSTPTMENLRKHLLV